MERRLRNRARRYGRVLAGASLAASATQLRATESAGPGEVLVILVVGSIWVFSRSKVGHHLGTDTARTVWFLLVMSAVGAITNAFVFDQLPLSALLGLGALTLLGVIMTFVATRPKPLEMLTEWAWVFGVSFVTTQSILYAAVRFGVPTPVFEPMYFGVRFQGWTTNPNQFALLTVVAAAAIALQARRSIWLRAPFVLAAFALAVASESDGFRLAIVAAVVAVAATYATSPRRSTRARQRLLGLTMILAGISLAAYKWTTILAVATGVADTGGQASDRVALWKSCITQLTRVPLTGLGPGPHGSLPGSTQLNECHNTFLDLGTTSGILAGLAFAALLFVLLRRAWKTSDTVAVACLTVITMMLMFGFLVRYTQLWLLLALIELRLRQTSAVRDPHRVRLL